MALLDPTENDSTLAPSKRCRVAVACDACRTRKSRCDGARPQCSLCNDLGFECIYTPTTTATNIIVQKSYFNALEDRVKKLEESVITVREDIDGLCVKAKGVNDGKRGHRSDSVPGLIGTEDEVDAMGAVTFVDEKDSGFFGRLLRYAFRVNLLILTRYFI
jgi:hypothetical protein